MPPQNMSEQPRRVLRIALASWFCLGLAVLLMIQAGGFKTLSVSFRYHSLESASLGDIPSLSVTHLQILLLVNFII